MRRSPQRPERRDDLPGTAAPPKSAPGLPEDTGRPAGDVERGLPDEPESSGRQGR